MMAAIPIQTRKTPGATTSAARRTRPSTHQLQGPSSRMTRSIIGQPSRLAVSNGLRTGTVRGEGWRAGSAGASPPPLPKTSRGNRADAAERTDQRGGLHRHQHDLGIGRGADRGHGLGVFLGDEVVDRLHVAGGDGFRDHLGGLGFGLGQTFARFGIAEGGFALAFGLQDGRLLGAFGAQDLGVARAFGFQDLGALFALGLHLAAPWHRRDPSAAGYP